MNAQFQLSKTKMWKCLWLSLLLLPWTSKAQERDACTTPNGQIGTCINLKECPPLVALLKKPRPLPSEVIEFLRKSQCGFNGAMPLVCCPGTSQEPNTVAPIPIEQPLDVSNHRNLRLLPLNICGPILTDKITNGNETALFEFPWMALIGYSVGGGGNNRITFRCAGTVINDKYILTAAHCVTSLPNGWSVAKVRLGEHDRTQPVDCFTDPFGTSVCADPYQDFDVENVIVHKGFSVSHLQHDVALIRVRRSIGFSSDSIKPVCLPIGSDQTRKLDGRKLTVTGWGVTEKGISSNILLKVAVPVTSVEECSDIYNKNNGTYINRIKISSQQICAGGVNGQDSCGGDSGGPLLYKGEVEDSLRFVQYGIVSFGPKPCALNGFPGVYTRVSHYMDWILNNMQS